MLVVLRLTSRQLLVICWPLLYITLNNIYRDSTSLRNFFNSFWAYSAICNNLSLCIFIFFRISVCVWIISFCFCIIQRSCVQVVLLLLLVIVFKFLLPISSKICLKLKSCYFINCTHFKANNGPLVSKILCVWIDDLNPEFFSHIFHLLLYVGIMQVLA